MIHGELVLTLKLVWNPKYRKIMSKSNGINSHGSKPILDRH